VALVGEARSPGRAGRLAIWGVRLGWVAQTGLLAAQAVRSDGFPWSSWAGALNLLAWFAVGGYLIWGCRPRYRLLGLGVMPAAAVLLALAYAGGGTGSDGHHPGPLLALHVAFMLAGFAGFAVSAALSGVYLWEERRLKGRAAGVLRVPLPPLASLDRLGVRTVAVSLASLTLGIVLGLADLIGDGGAFDPAMAATLAAWALYGGSLVLRPELRLYGRRAAWSSLACFAAVVAVLPLTHFA
jgi:ABC-type uncharacterized transport system permease subunit